MIRRHAVVSAVGLPGLVLVLAACTSSPPEATATTVPAATSASTPTVPAPTPTPTPTATPAKGPTLPAVRWDKVPRGPLPSGCVTVGETRVFVGARTVYAEGPSLSCGSGGRYWVRAVVKVAEDHGNGHWTYLTTVQPSEPVRNAAAAPRTAPRTCPSGKQVRAVASFVFTDAAGHQVRYRRIGSTATCP